MTLHSPVVVVGSAHPFLRSVADAVAAGASDGSSQDFDAVDSAGTFGSGSISSDPRLIFLGWDSSRSDSLASLERSLDSLTARGPFPVRVALFQVRDAPSVASVPLFSVRDPSRIDLVGTFETSVPTPPSGADELGRAREWAREILTYANRNPSPRLIPNERKTETPESRRAVPWCGIMD